MKFVLQATALNVEDDRVFALIDRLVDRMADEVHLVDMVEADLLEASRWFHGARPTRRKLLMSALARPPRRTEDHPGPHRRVVKVMDAESARTAEKLAHTPLVILLEDRESDGVLLDIVVDELGWQSLRRFGSVAERLRPVPPSSKPPEEKMPSGSGSNVPWGMPPRRAGLYVFSSSVTATAGGPVMSYRRRLPSAELVNSTAYRITS
jgi:hypothetical protein